MFVAYKPLCVESYGQLAKVLFKYFIRVTSDLGE